MDIEVAGLIATVTAAAGAAGAFLLKRPEPSPPVVVRPQAPTLPIRKKTTPDHIHEAVTANPQGWFCDCGKHKHVYVFAMYEGKGADRKELETRRCQCGAIGVGKEWAID